jgi:hypothetical protein
MPALQSVPPAPTFDIGTADVALLPFAPVIAQPPTDLPLSGALSAKAT